MSPDNPTPKQRFCASAGNVANHRAMIQSEPFDRAIDYALLEFTRRLNQNTANDFAVRGAMLKGAQEFLNTLITLAETAPPPAARKDPDNLS